MQRRNFIKNIAALTVVSQIAQAADLKSIDQTPGILLTLQSAGDKIEFKVIELSLNINCDEPQPEIPAPFPPSYIKDLIFIAKLTEGQQWFIRDALSSRDEIQFTFKIDDLVYESNGLIMKCGFADTNECNVTLRIKSGNFINN